MGGESWEKVGMDVVRSYPTQRFGKSTEVGALVTVHNLLLLASSYEGR